MSLQRPDATVLMNSAAKGDLAAANTLMPLVFNQLRKAAQHMMASERPGHTLSATALVHEAYLKLAGPREVPWSGRAQFYKAAAESMRQILLDHAKAKGRAKRGGGRGRLEVRDLADLAAAESDDILRFDDELSRLEAEDPESATVVRLRFFAGLSAEDSAAALGVSRSTVDRRWAFARAWLAIRLAAAE